jgi:hypothetical protein
MMKHGSTVSASVSTQPLSPPPSPFLVAERAWLGCAIPFFAFSGRSRRSARDAPRAAVCVPIGRAPLRRHSAP